MNEKMGSWTLTVHLSKDSQSDMQRRRERGVCEVQAPGAEMVAGATAQLTTGPQLTAVLEV